ncbi:MAG: hypothetical protein JRF63_08665 [Deltaproteobacteria bacterium]|nr:hypothetical protein [Deltaproteobacteria bacterium]
MTDDEYVIDNPYAPPAQGGIDSPRAPERPVVLEPDRGASLMKMGIIGAFFLGMFPPVSIILGIIGWSRAKHDLEKMEMGVMTMEHGARPKTRAGLILGKINTIVGPFAIPSLILMVWAQIEAANF